MLAQITGVSPASFRGCAASQKINNEDAKKRTCQQILLLRGSFFVSLVSSWWIF